MAEAVLAESVGEVQGARSSGRFYRPELDLLRFVAFSLVFLSHSSWRDRWARFGMLGVPVFFLLSAYLITELLLREKERTGTVQIRSFYVRRVLRIWPLYFAALLVGSFALRVFTHHLRVSSEDLAWYLLFAGNWRAATHGYLPFGLGVLWSISVEEQFYLFWPTLVRWVSTRSVLYFAIAMWLGSQLAVAVLCAKGIPFEPGIWCNTFVDFQYFAVGAAISVLMNGRAPKVPIFLRGTMGIAGLTLLFFCRPLLMIGQYPRVYEILPGMLLAGVGGALIFLSLLGVKLPRPAAPAIYLGKVSYGLYVMHLCVWNVVSMILLHFLGPHSRDTVQQYALTLAMTFLLASLSYKYFENPFLRLKSRFEVVKSRPA